MLRKLLLTVVSDSDLDGGAFIALTEANLKEMAFRLSAYRKKALQERRKVMESMRSNPPSRMPQLPPARSSVRSGHTQVCSRTVPATTY